MERNLPLDDVFPKELASVALITINPKENIRKWLGSVIFYSAKQTVLVQLR